VPDAIRQQEGQTLRAAIAAAGKTPKTVAADAQISASYLSQIQSGNRPMSLDAAGKLAKALGVNLEDLSPRLAAATHQALQLASPPPRASSPGRAVYKIERKPSLDQAILTLAEHLAAVDRDTRHAALSLLGKLEAAPEDPASVVRLVKAVIDSGKRAQAQPAAPESIASP